MADDFKKYGEAWTGMMTRIWTDRLDLLGVYDTGALRRSVVDGLWQSNEDFTATAEFRFLLYGIFVDAGTGREVPRGNDGHIERFRKENGGKKRQAKEWFSPSWAISKRVLMERAARIVGDRFTGLFDELKESRR